MPGPLPEFIDPYDCAKTGRRLAGVLPLASLERLCADLADRSGEVEVAVEAQVQTGGLPVLTGRAACAAVARCQRCLEPLTLHLEAPFRLGLVASESAAARLETGYDPLICAPGQELAVAGLIEDELLLVLPDYPLHAPGVCGMVAEPAQQTEKQRPFAALATLRKR